MGMVCVLYFLLNLLDIKVPTNKAADSANPKYDKFLSYGKTRVDPIKIAEEIILIGRTFEFALVLFSDF
jgi:hypothetical protein